MGRQVTILLDGFGIGGLHAQIEFDELFLLAALVVSLCILVKVIFGCVDDCTSTKNVVVEVVVIVVEEPAAEAEGGVAAVKENSEDATSFK